MTAPVIFCYECGAANPLQVTHCFACNNALHPSSRSPLLQVQATSTSAGHMTSKSVGPLAPSSLLNSRYSIVSQAGTGGFGAVYQARDTLFSHRLVAIKEMNQDGLGPQELAEATAAFEREALLLTDLIHPNLPRIHDHFTEHGRAYVVMDFIAGDTLEDYLDKFSQHLPLDASTWAWDATLHSGLSSQRLPVEMVLEIGIQLCSVLDYLHSHQPPIIFRDLKPANIMRTAGNHVYLIDFGIARHFKPGKAKDTIPLGSKGYAAPEQYGKAQSTPQSDIYALGATLHQLLTGTDPSLALFHFEPIPASKPPIVAQVNALLQQMLEMEMSKRPASMAIVKLELQRILAQQMEQKPGRAVKRRTFVKGCLTMVATCGVGIGIATIAVEKPNLIDVLFAHPLIGTKAGHAFAPHIPDQAMFLSKALYTYRGHSGSVTAVAWSPDGHYIASAGAIDSSVQIWDAKTGSLALVPVPPREKAPALFTTNERVDALAWSPESTRIASALGNDSVDIWRMATGAHLLFPFSQLGNVNVLAWSPDGSRIAALSGSTAVEVRSATTGKRIFTYPGHEQAVLALAWSPNGKYIASGSADGIVKVWNATTRDTYGTYSRHTAAVNAVAWSPDSKHIASGGADETVQVWETATRRTLFTYRGHRGSVNTLAWQRGPLLLSGREARIASGGDDDTVQVWSIGSDSKQTMALQGKILMYLGHSGPITSLMWSPDGQLIASSSEDGTVQVWQAV